MLTSKQIPKRRGNKIANWTVENVPDFNGKTVIVTGANSGIGYETALAMARKGAQVVMACRNIQKGETAAAAIRGEVSKPLIEVMPLDLADLASVRAFAAAFGQKYSHLHILYNNAGVMAIPYAKSVDGFEMQFASNHLGHFALTGLLLDTLLGTPKARVVNTSSILHKSGKFDFANLSSDVGYTPGAAYSRSKMANLLFTYELQRKLEAIKADVISVAAHPGYSATNLQFVGPQLEGSAFRARMAGWMNNILAQSAYMGSLPNLYAGVAPDVQGGDYIGPAGLMEMRGYPTKVRSVESSYDRALAAKLWQVSEDLTNVHYDRLKLEAV